MVGAWICYNKKIYKISRGCYSLFIEKSDGITLLSIGYIIAECGKNLGAWFCRLVDLRLLPMIMAGCLPNQPPTKVTFVTEAGLILQIQTNATRNKSISILKNYSRNLICSVLPTNPYTRENTFFFFSFQSKQTLFCSVLVYLKTLFANYVLFQSQVLQWCKWKVLTTTYPPIWNHRHTSKLSWLSINTTVHQSCCSSHLPPKFEFSYVFVVFMSSLC